MWSLCVNVCSISVLSLHMTTHNCKPILVRFYYQKQPNVIAIIDFYNIFIKECLTRLNIHSLVLIGNSDKAICSKLRKMEKLM